MVSFNCFPAFISDIAHHDTVFSSHKINWCPFKASSGRVYAIISRCCLPNDSLHVWVSLGDVMSEINALVECTFTSFFKNQFHAVVESKLGNKALIPWYLCRKRSPSRRSRKVTLRLRLQATWDWSLEILNGRDTFRFVCRVNKPMQNPVSQ